MNFFDGQVAAWSNPPVDDVGYIPSSSMLQYTDDQLWAMIEKMRWIRYSEQAWRNWEGGLNPPAPRPRAGRPAS